MLLTLSNIIVYPIKSLAGINLVESKVEGSGLARDRMLMLVDENGLFITQRKYPSLAIVDVRFAGDIIIVSAPGKHDLIIEASFFNSEKMHVTVWKDNCTSLVANSDINHWFSDFLEKKVYLVKYDESTPRKTDPEFSIEGDSVSFADGFPVLLISNPSLYELNLRLDTAVTMNNFRPNIVVNGGIPFQEDSWNQIQIGEVKFDLVKRCSRCILTTINPRTGKRSLDGQPLKELSSYRKGTEGVMFGMNLIPRSSGSVRYNDKIVILS